MTALGYHDLMGRLAHSDVSKRLVVSPILDKASQVNERQAAIDVRLGRAFTVVKPWTYGVAEAIGAHPTFDPAVEEMVLDFGEALIIHPHQFVLARTLEFVRLPRDLLSYVIGRSSWGRRGLIVATAVVVHPGFAGPITLELKNVGEVPLALYPLDRIAQLTFHSTAGASSQAAPAPGPASAADASQFASSFSPSLGTVRDPRTIDRLRKLVKRRTGP